MFKITKKDKRSELDKEIDNLLKTMNEMEDPTSDSYKILSERVETLCQARSSYVKDDRKINPNTVLTVAGSLAGILLIVVVENKDLIIRSKALPFVLKGRVYQHALSFFVLITHSIIEGIGSSPVG